MYGSVQPTIGAMSMKCRSLSLPGLDGGVSCRESFAVLDLPDEAATCTTAARIAALLRPGDVLALWGGLGVGKTVFARALLRTRAGASIEVPSPTFTLVQVYETLGPGACDIFHFDLYRIDAPEDALELGIDDAFADGISLIEWPDRLGLFLPAVRLDLVFSDVPGQPSARRLELGGHDDWTGRLAEAGLA